MRAPPAHAQPSPAPESLRSTGGPRSHVWMVGLVVGGCAFVLYALACARGPEWQDSGFHQYRILTGELLHPLGLALSHPLHFHLGRLFLLVPTGDPLFRLNLLSAAAGAAGVGLLAALLKRLTRWTPAPFVGALALLVSLSYWQMSALTETYTLAAALMILEWNLLLSFTRTGRPGWLVAVFGVNGLHVANHMLGTLSGVTYVALALTLLFRRRLPWLWTPLLAAAWLLGSAPYWTLAVSFYQQTGSLAGTLHSAFFGGSGEMAGWADAVLNLVPSELAPGILAYNFPSVALPLAIVGLWRRPASLPRTWYWILIAQLLIYSFFVARYGIVDLHTFFVPVCALMAFWCGVGADRLAQWWPFVRRPAGAAAAAALTVVPPLLVYLAFPPLVRAYGWFDQRFRDAPVRDEASAFLRPWRRSDDSAREFAHLVLQRAGADGWVLADSTTGFPVALVCLLEGAPQGVRVYTGRSQIFPVRGSELTDAELWAHVEQGLPVVAVPGPAVSAIWAQRFLLRPLGDEFLTIHAEDLGKVSDPR